MDKLLIIKIGGNIIDDEVRLGDFLKEFAKLSAHKILIHGGGKLATKLADQLNIPQQMIEGRRVTDEETLKIVTMVYAGYINKNIVARLQADNCNAIGLTGADGNAIQAHKRINADAEYGFAGDIDTINTSFLKNLLHQTLTPVIAPITHNKKGQLLNTNADTIAQEIAKSLSDYFEVQLIYLFEKAGVLKKVEDENSVIQSMNVSTYQNLKVSNTIHSGMIPKLDNAFAALQSGVQKVIIGKPEMLSELVAGVSGTTILNE